jgi:hypothetical protein
MATQALKDQLADWTDFDFAAFYLSQHLGLLSPEIEKMAGAKWVFWSANPIGDALGRILEELTELGVLEYDPEELRFRWNPEFKVVSR